MNKARRKELHALKEKIEAIQSDIYDIIVDLCNQANEEQDYIDNMPENLQESEHMSKAESAIEYLDEAKDALENITDELNDAASSIEMACE